MFTSHHDDWDRQQQEPTDEKELYLFTVKYSTN